MRREPIPAAQARLVHSRALRNYAQSLGWQAVEGINGSIAVYHRPDSLAHQVIVPLDEQFDDYAEMVFEAVERLAEYEKRPAREVLEHLLLPPSDLLQFHDSGVHAAEGTIPLDEAVELLAGARKALLAQAHSVLQPRPFHPRLSRSEAEEFVNACRFGQTRHGSFTVVLACPLDAVLTETSLFDREPRFARRVTTGLMRALDQLASVADQDRADELLQPDKALLLSANLCEALLQMQPAGERPTLTISATWSRAVPPPEGVVPNSVRLTQEVFTVAQQLAPRLRSVPQPVPAWFFGWVDVLKSQPGPDDRPSGPVQLMIFHENEPLRASLDLSADDHAIAIRAYEGNVPVKFRGVLYRAPRLSRITHVSDFQLLDLPQPNP